MEVNPREIRKKILQMQDKVYKDYMRVTPRSKRMYHRARHSMVGGIYSVVGFYQPYVPYMVRGRGSRIYDVDGNEYIDCNLALGPLVLGHCHPDVMQRVQAEINRGLHIFNPDFGIECAELLKKIIPCAEKVVFANTGADANMFAVRVARAYTRKNKIIKFYGHYHGMHDQFLLGLSNTSNEATSAGIPKESLFNTIQLRYDDTEALRCKLDEDNDVAAVILDPGMNMGGIWPPRHGYLKEVRQITQGRGVILIFDEILTGFRLALGGAQEYFGVTPDLATFAKGMVSGAKLSALVGKEDVLNALVPRVITAHGAKAASHGGTYNGGTVPLAAAIATLQVLKKLSDKGEYHRLFQRSEKLKKGIESAFERKGLPCHINMLGPSLKIFLTDLEPSFETYCKLDPTVAKFFAVSLLTEGIFSHVRKQTLYLSFAHTEDDVEQIIGAVNSSLDKYEFEAIM